MFQEVLDFMGDGEEFDIIETKHRSYFSLASGATRDITVNQKPKFIIIVRSPVGTTDGRFYLNIYNVNTNRCINLQRASDWTNTITDGRPSIITTLTDSKVTIKNSSETIQYRYGYAIYY